MPDYTGNSRRLPVRSFRTMRPKTLVALTVLLLLCPARGQDKAPDARSRATTERWREATWWPTKGSPARSEYAGAEPCYGCHAGIAATQRMTPMFHAASRPSESELLRRHERLPFSEGDYQYVLSHQPGESKFLVQSATEAITSPIDWAFGSGEVAQTYVLKHKDDYLESRLTYYTSLMALGITTGHDGAIPEKIQDTLGNAIGSEVAPLCFGCHTTGSTTAGKFDPNHAMLGLTCEACHGPGAKHVVAMKSGDKVPLEKTIFAANHLSPVDSVDFCGACHRTPADVSTTMPARIGIASLRFQPYRLERSLCWGQNGDARITCVACHNPHQPLVKDPMAYDAKCLSCHAKTGESPTSTLLAGCTTGKKECVTCHMPKYEIPAVHAPFTDHYIRIVRTGSGFRP